MQELQDLADRVEPALTAALGAIAAVDRADCLSQIGSGSLPTDRLPSLAVRLTPARRGGRALQRLATAFRNLPVPVIGHVSDNRLWFDLRCLDDPARFAAQLAQLTLD